MQIETSASPSYRRALLGARIIFNNSSSVFDCVVRRISDTGAVIDVGSAFVLPSMFMLETKPFKTRYRCSVTRRNLKSIEVAFLPAGTA